MNTKHGHHISGTYSQSVKPEDVFPCGAPDKCAQCSIEVRRTYEAIAAVDTISEKLEDVLADFAALREKVKLLPETAERSYAEKSLEEFGMWIVRVK